MDELMNSGYILLLCLRAYLDLDRHQHALGTAVKPPDTAFHLLRARSRGDLSRYPVRILMVLTACLAPSRRNQSTDERVEMERGIRDNDRLYERSRMRQRVLSRG